MTCEQLWRSEQICTVFHQTSQPEKPSPSELSAPARFSQAPTQIVVAVCVQHSHKRRDVDQWMLVCKLSTIKLPACQIRTTLLAYPTSPSVFTVLPQIPLQNPAENPAHLYVVPGTEGIWLHRFRLNVKKDPNSSNLQAGPSFHIAFLKSLLH